MRSWRRVVDEMESHLEILRPPFASLGLMIALSFFIMPPCADIAWTGLVSIPKRVRSSCSQATTSRLEILHGEVVLARSDTAVRSRVLEKRSPRRRCTGTRV